MSHKDPFVDYILLVKSQHKITVDFTVEEVGREVNHVEGTGMKDMEDELPTVHYLLLPVGYVLCGCRFKKSKKLRYFIVNVTSNTESK